MIWLNGSEIDFKKFPNEETLVPDLTRKDFGRYVAYRNHQPVPCHVVRFKYESDEDLLHLWFIARHLTESKFLTIDYLPYSRMDRQVDGSCFTLKHVADLINEMGFEEIEIMEPHSEVSLNLIKNSKPVYDSEYLIVDWVMPQILWLTGVDYIVFPDEGAHNRYGMTLPDEKVLIGHKTRDFATGKITGLKIDKPEEEIEELANALIWDDLCSRGGTFMAAGKQLKEMGFNRVNLYVTHLEKAAFEGDLLKPESPIDKVFATDSMWTYDKIPNDTSKLKIHRET